MAEEENALKHYGVLGMKWGVRRSPEQLARARGRRKADKAIKAKRRQQYANRRLLSDGDLDRFTKRLEKEKRLRELTESEITPGQKFVKAITSDAGKIALTSAISGAIGYGLKAAMKKEFNLSEAANYIVKKPK